MDTESIDFYLRWLSEHVPHAHANLAPGASDAEIAAVEELVGHEMPAALKNLWERHNGQRETMLSNHIVPATPCLPTLSFLSTHCVSSIWLEWADLRKSLGPEELSKLNSGCSVTKNAAGRVKPIYTAPGWVPLCADPTRPDYLGLDFDPDQAGCPGQIMNFGRNEDRHFVAARSFEEFLDLLVQAVRSGEWSASEIGFGDRTIPWFGSPEKSFFNVASKGLAGQAGHKSTTQTATRTVRRTTSKASPSSD